MSSTAVSRLVTERIRALEAEYGPQPPVELSNPAYVMKWLMENCYDDLRRAECEDQAAFEKNLKAIGAKRQF